MALRPPARLLLALTLLPLLLLAAACRPQPPAPATPPPTETPPLTSAARADSEPPAESATRTRAPLPTLYPTFTPAAGFATPTPTLAPTPTAGPTVDFSQPVVTFRLTIPEIGYDRRIPARGSDREVYTVTLPEKGTYTVNGRLLYRSFRQSYMDALEFPHPPLEVVEMTRASAAAVY